MPKRSDTVFTQRTVSRDFLFVNFLENPLAKSIAKRIVLIFKHAVVFLYIFAESKVAVTVQLNNINSFFVNCITQRFFIIFCRLQIHYNVLRFLYTPLRFCTIFTESKVAVTV